MAEPIIRTEHLSRSFGTVKAVDDFLYVEGSVPTRRRAAQRDAETGDRFLARILQREHGICATIFNRYQRKRIRTGVNLPAIQIVLRA